MQNLSHYQFDKNPLWDDIMVKLKDMIAAEVSEALAQEVDRDIRSHQCGRAEALTDFKYALIETWEKANPGKNIDFNA